MKHGNYQTSHGKIHRYCGRKDIIYGGVYECGLCPTHSDDYEPDVMMKKKITCKKCIKKQMHAVALARLMART